jgi:hypothetical protein
LPVIVVKRRFANNCACSKVRASVVTNRKMPMTAVMEKFAG